MHRSFFSCPECGNTTRVTSINRRDPKEVRRYRKCAACGHTFATTQPPEVVADTRDWQRVPRGEKHFNAKLTEAKVIEMRQYAAEGNSSLECSLVWGISQRAAYCAIVGITWKHVPMPDAPAERQSA